MRKNQRAAYTRSELDSLSIPSLNVFCWSWSWPALGESDGAHGAHLGLGVSRNVDQGYDESFIDLESFVSDNDDDDDVGESQLEAGSKRDCYRRNSP
jgi:hypothetical protein